MKLFNWLRPGRSSSGDAVRDPSPNEDAVRVVGYVHDGRIPDELDSWWEWPTIVRPYGVARHGGSTYPGLRLPGREGWLEFVLGTRDEKHRERDKDRTEWICLAGLSNCSRRGTWWMLGRRTKEYRGQEYIELETSVDMIQMFLSREQARISYDGNGFRIENVSKVVSMTVDGAVLSPGEAAPLEEDSVILIPPLWRFVFHEKPQGEDS